MRKQQETISVDIDLLQHIANAIQLAHEGFKQTLDDDERMRLMMLSEDLYGLNIKYDLIQRADVFFEDSNIKIMENPELGDEGSVMVLDKQTGWFAPESPFFDCENMDEIFDWMCEQQR